MVTLQGHPTRSPIYLKQRAPPLPLRSGNHSYNIKYGPAPKPLGYQNKGGLISKGIFTLVPSSKKLCQINVPQHFTFDLPPVIRRKKSIKYGVFAELSVMGFELQIIFVKSYFQIFYFKNLKS